ncbi:MAG: pitrilysin family protein [Elusimicrobiota bacterium]|jgi:zinc protease
MNRLILSAVLVLSVLPASAQNQAVQVVQEEPDRSKLVPPAPARPVHLSSVQKDSLANGLRVALIELRRNPLVAATLVFPLAGSSFDPEGKQGLADAVAALMTEGAGKLDGRAFADAAADLGTEVSVSASDDALTVSVVSLKENFDKALALAADAVRLPAFPADQLERVRTEALAGLDEEKGSPGALAGKRIYARVFPNHPYGRSPDEKSLKALSLNDVQAFHASQVRPEGAVLAASGDINMAELRALAQKHFGDWTAKTQAPAVAAVPAAEESVSRQKGLVIDIIDFPGAKQSTLRVGRASIARSDPDYIPAMVLNFVLGEAPMMSRLDANLRETHSWTYGARSKLTALRKGGLFLAATDVQVDATAPALKEIFNEICRMREEPVPAKELDMLKRMFAGFFLMKQQSVAGVAGQVAGIELNGLSADAVAAYRDQVMAVTAEDLIRVAQKHWTAQELQVVIAGDAAVIRGALSEIAPVRVLGIDGKPKSKERV